MSEFLFFVLGVSVGGLFGMTIMCIIQVNKLNELERLEHLRKENEKKND